MKSQSTGTLPREARALLIMIDGKKDYKNYLNTLDDRKLFASFGGITPLLELLLELKYIEIMGANDTRPNTFMTSHSQPTSQSFDDNHGVIKSDLAIYIEKNIPPGEAWGYLLMLEQCEDNLQLSILIQEIQNISSGHLSRGMNKFLKRIPRYS